MRYDTCSADRVSTCTNILIELAPSGASMPNSPHRAPPATETVPTLRMPGFDDPLMIHHRPPFALQ